MQMFKMNRVIGLTMMSCLPIACGSSSPTGPDVADLEKTGTSVSALGRTSPARSMVILPSPDPAPKEGSSNTPPFNVPPAKGAGTPPTTDDGNPPANNPPANDAKPLPMPSPAPLPTDGNKPPSDNNTPPFNVPPTKVGGTTPTTDGGNNTPSAPTAH